VVPKRYWPGTKVERASLGIPVVYDQVEAAFPIILRALYGQGPKFFGVKALGQTQPQAADAAGDVIADYLDSPMDADTGATSILPLSLALRQSMIYGDGPIALSWSRQLARPIIRWVDLRNLYLDPKATGPMIEQSPVVIERQMLTVAQLREMAQNDNRIKLPSPGALNFLAKSRFSATADVLKDSTGAIRGEQPISSEMNADPKFQQIEVLLYWTPQRMIWVLNRLWPLMNAENPYGFVPYCKAPYGVALGRPYSMALADVLEGEQKLQQGITNARVDNLALGIQPPRVRAQGNVKMPSQTAWRPGLEDIVGDPAKDVSIVTVQDMTKDAYREIQLSEARASKRTGVNDFVQSGVPAPSNANRSAYGVSQQMGNVSSRLYTPVVNQENYLIVPMLYKIHRMIQKFAPEVLQVGSQRVPKAQAAAPVKFAMQGASRMIQQEKLLMLLPTIGQTLFNEVVMRQANVQGRTLDFAEFDRFFREATGTEKMFAFFRPMSQQEQQAARQPDPKDMLELQKAQMEAQTRMAMGKMKQETDMTTTKMEVGAKLEETGERSARELLKLLKADKSNDAEGRGATKSGGSSDK